MSEVCLGNNYKFKVCTASYKDATHLKNLMLKNLKIKGLNLESVDFEKLLDMDINSDGGDFILSVVDLIKELEANEDIEAQIIKCAQKCSINKEKVTEETFDNPDLWPYLIEIKVEIIKANVLPFFKNLPSTLSKIMEKVTKVSSES